MFWGAFRLSSEHVLGTFHCVLRARRVDVARSPTWDDLYRGTLNPPGDMRDVDMPWWLLQSIAYDLPHNERGNEPS